MAIVFKMPALSPTMKNGTLVNWCKKEGDEIAVGDVLLEVDTDKATMEVESVYKGVLEKILVQNGTHNVNVGTPIGLIRERSDTTKIPANAELECAEIPDIKTDTSDIFTRKKETENARSKVERIKSSPLARRISNIHGIDIASIKQGTGVGGRIVKDDVVKAITSDNLTDYIVNKQTYADEPLPHIQQLIAEKLANSKQKVPHFYMAASINVTDLLKIRKKINENAMLPIKLTVTDFIIKAVALAMRATPQINVTWYDGKIRRYQTSNIAVAIATKNGIFAPVIYDADSKSILEISKELKKLIELAKNKRIPVDKTEGGTITVSNLGMFKIDRFFAIINSPQGSILSVGPAQKTPVYNEKDELTPVDVIQFGYSMDHRMINGTDGACFLEQLKKYLECPFYMLSV
jgi:pyruvate dehydrogenase E2 component (dihydrolipoamide acetyltransferase)